MAIRLNDALAKKRLDATVNGGAGVDFDSGTIKFYTGVQPATADTAASGTLIATIALTATSFANATGTGPGGRSASLNGTPLSVNAAAGGQIGWARIADASGVYCIDADVGQGSGSISVDNTTLTSGQQLQVTALSLTE